MGDTTINISGAAESVVHAALIAQLETLREKCGLLVQSVHVEWVDVSQINKQAARIQKITVTTSSGLAVGWRT